MLQEELSKIWGTWQVDEMLGEGSFGKVYRIEKKESKEYKAALKVIRIPQNEAEVTSVMNDGMDKESVIQYFKSSVDDLKKEFDLMYKLKGNTNIVSYEDHEVIPVPGKIGWNIYIRMELLTPLFDYLKEKPLSIRDVIRLGIDICNALEICQTYNIIHRDIKPENIFVSELGNFKLGDFGIARQLEKTSSGLSKKGTYSYMAPEVYKGEEYNSTVDIYSLGIVLYRFLNNNRTPFLPAYPAPIRYSDKEKANVLRMSGTPVPKPCMAEGRLAEIILKACSYDPKDRYESASDMKRALESVLYEEAMASVAYPKGDKIDNQNFDYTSTVADKGTSATTQQEDTFAAFPGTPLYQEHKQAIEDEQEKRKEEKIEEIHKEEIIEKEIFEEESYEEESYEEEKTSVGEIAPIEKKPSKSKKGVIVAVILAVIAIAAVVGSSMYKKSLQREVPYLVNMTIDEAKALTDLAINVSGKEYSDSVEKGDIISQSVQSGTIVTVEDTIDVVISKGALVKVPSVKGKTVAKAKEIVEKAGLKFVISAEKYSDDVKKGKVISQSSKKGKKLEEGSVVDVVVSKGVEKVKVPNVVGKSESKAKDLLKNAKLTYTTSSEYSSSVEEGKVISQSVEAGDKVKKKTEVKLVISLGEKPQPVYTPSYSKPSKKKPTKKKPESIDSWEVVN